MLFNVNFINLSFFKGSNLLPTITSYDSMTIFGGGIFDKLWIVNKDITKISDQEMQQYFNIPKWTIDTTFLANFNLNLTAGNIDIPGENPVAWRISKRAKDSSINQYINTVPPTITEYKDYIVKNGTEYIYEITPITTNAMGQALKSTSILSDYYGWFLIDEEEGICFNFDINVESGSINAESDQTEYETFNQFNTYSQGKRNFIRGNIKGIVPESLPINGTTQMIQSPEFIQTLQDFINNGKRKLLKSRKGDMWYVMTTDFSREQLSDSIQDQIDVVSFSFSEVGKVSGY